MNSKQQNYAMQRVSSICDSKIDKIRVKHTTPAVELTIEELVDLIIAGKVKKRKYPNYEYYGSQPSVLRCIFDFSKFESKAKRDNDKIIKESKSVTDECKRIQDQIMLGDSEEALSLIIAFEKI